MWKAGWPFWKRLCESGRKIAIIDDRTEAHRFLTVHAREKQTCGCRGVLLDFATEARCRPYYDELLAPIEKVQDHGE